MTELSAAVDEGAAGIDQDAPSGRKLLLFVPGPDLDPVIESFLGSAPTAGQGVVVALHQGPRGEGAGVTYMSAPARTDLWRIPAGAIRRRLDYLDYLEAKDHGTAIEPEPPTTWGMRAILFLPPFRWPFGRRMLRAVLARLEAAMPLPRAVRSFIAEQNPDVVAVSPLTGFGSSQVDYVRAAHAEATPSLGIVRSGDELTGPGRIREVPTLTLVPGAALVDAATSLQELPGDRVAVLDTGATNGSGAAGISGVEAIERAAGGEPEAGSKGRFLRPVLWLLTPLLAILLPLLRPRATAVATARAVRELPNRIRKRRKVARRERDQKRDEATASAKARKRAEAEEARARKLARAELKGRPKVKGQPKPTAEDPKSGQE